MREEIWRPIAGHEQYEVSNHGNARHIPWRRDGIARNLKFYFNKGYPYISIRDGLRLKKLPIHRCVLIAFRGEPDSEKLEACHLDGDRKNSRLENLSWGTRKMNEWHKSLHGTSPIGEKNASAKLRELDVGSILDRINKGHLLKDIASDFCVSRSSISHIKLGDTWSHVSARLTQGQRLVIK